MKIKRLPNNPIIRPHMDERLGSNINGPSLIRAPAWVPNPLGRYYLYFGHHQGTYIRLAYADDLNGPWRVYTPGVLDLAASFFDMHLASPEAIVMPEQQQIWLYYHGCCPPDSPQLERVAISKDGLDFSAQPEVLGWSYWRIFDWGGYRYGLGMPGKIYRSKNGLTDFEAGPTLFTPNMRHSAVRLVGHTLQVFYSNVGDCPERILLSTIDLRPDWLAWIASEPVTVLEPEMDYEGAKLPLEPSERGSIHEPVRQLRDPCIFEEEGRVYLLYAVAGEAGIASARIEEPDL